MTERLFKEVTIRLGIWDHHPLFGMDEGEWRDWVGAVVRERLMEYGSSPQYSVKLETHGPSAAISPKQRLTPRPYRVTLG